MMLVWKNLRMVKTGIATQRVSPRDVAMISDDIDISDTSKSAKRSCRQNISDGCTMVGTSLIPCGTTRPSSSGRVRSLSDSAMLNSRRLSVMVDRSLYTLRRSFRPHAEEVWRGPQKRVHARLSTRDGLRQTVSKHGGGPRPGKWPCFETDRRGNAAILLSMRGCRRGEVAQASAGTLT